MKAWLIDFAREGSGKGTQRPLGCPPDARFGVQARIKPPKAYYQGPMTLIQAWRAIKLLERCWGK